MKSENGWRIIPKDNKCSHFGQALHKSFIAPHAFFKAHSLAWAQTFKFIIRSLCRPRWSCCWLLWHNISESMPGLNSFSRHIPAWYLFQFQQKAPAHRLILFIHLKFFSLHLVQAAAYVRPGMDAAQHQNQLAYCGPEQAPEEGCLWDPTAHLRPPEDVRPRIRGYHSPIMHTKKIATN